MILQPIIKCLSAEISPCVLFLWRQFYHVVPCMPSGQATVRILHMKKNFLLPKSNFISDAEILLPLTCLLLSGATKYEKKKYIF